MRCRVCGREFDPRGFQVVVPGLGMGFDRVECALEASATGVPLIESPPPLPIAAPRPALVLPAVATAGAAALPVASAASAPSARAPMLVGANLALLAAGTAATIYLWMRVFSPDAAFQPVPAEHAAVAFARSTVSAEVDVASGPTARPQPEVVVFDNRPGTQGSAGAVAVSNRERTTTGSTGGVSGGTPTPSKGGGSSGPVVRPTQPPAPPPPPPEEPPPPPPRQTPTPAPPVPTSPPSDRVPGAPLPGPGLPDSGSTGVGGRQGS